MAGTPAEFFHPGDEPFWSSRWGTRTFDDYVAACLRETSTPNGVWGAKLMANQLGELCGRLRAARHGNSDAALLASAFGDVRYVWLRREDKVRQAVSWWRADQTGQYALDMDELPAAVVFDGEAIDRLVVAACEHEDVWRRWFAANGLDVLEVTYEELVADLPACVSRLIEWIGESPPDDLTSIAPRSRRQADDLTEQLVGSYRSWSNTRNHP